MSFEEKVASEPLKVENLEQAPMKTTLIAKCDASSLMQVEQNLVDIVVYQSLRSRVEVFKRPFIHSKKRQASKHWALIRKILLVLSTVVTLFLLYQVMFEPFNKFFSIMLPIYLILSVLLWLLKPPYDRMNSQRFADNIDKKLATFSARKMLRVAKKLLPYEAHYEFSGDSVSYYRKKKDSSELVWTRELKGFAIVHQHVTLFYNRPNGIAVRILIMHEDPQPMVTILTTLNINFICYSPEIYSELQTKLK